MGSNHRPADYETEGLVSGDIQRHRFPPVWGADSHAGVQGCQATGENDPFATLKLTP